MSFIDTLRRDLDAIRAGRELPRRKDSPELEGWRTRPSRAGWPLETKAERQEAASKAADTMIGEGVRGEIPDSEEVPWRRELDRQLAIAGEDVETRQPRTKALAMKEYATETPEGEAPPEEPRGFMESVGSDLERIKKSYVLPTKQEERAESEGANWFGEGGVFANAPAGMVAASKNAAAELAVAGQEEAARDIERGRMGPGITPADPLRGGTYAEAFPETQPVSEETKKRRKEAANQARDAGKKLQQFAAQTKKEMELVTPKGMDIPQQAMWSFIQSSPPTLLGIAVGITTRNPIAAMALAGGGGSLFQTGATYGEAREKVGHDIAWRAAQLDGVLEGIGEAIPLRVALKSGSPFVRKLVQTIIEEAGQEGITQIMQDLNAFLSYKPDITLKEAWDNFKVAVLAGAIGGTVYGTFGAAVSGEEQQQAPTPVAPATPPPGEAAAGEQPPPGPAPEGPQAAPEPADRDRFTHRLDDGTRVRPHTEKGQPVPGLWLDEEGGLHEAQRADPVQKVEPNATWSINGVNYDVAVVDKGRVEGTARLDDGQEVRISELELADESKQILGLMPEPEAPETKKKAAAPIEKPPSQQQPAAEVAAKPAPTVPGRPAETPPPPPLSASPGPAERVGAPRMIDLVTPAAPAVPEERPVQPVDWMEKKAQRALTSKEIARRDKLSKRMKAQVASQRRVDVERDSIVPAIIRLGGISKDYQLDISGDTKGNIQVGWVGALFTKAGEAPDGIARRLAEYGYLTEEQAEDPNIMTELIRDELAGLKKHWSVWRESTQEEEFEKLRPTENEGVMYEDIEAQAEGLPLSLDITPEDLESGGLDVNATNAAAVDLLSQLPEEEAEALAKQHEEASPQEFLNAVRAAVAAQEVQRGEEIDRAEPAGTGEEGTQAAQPKAPYGRGKVAGKEAPARGKGAAKARAAEAAQRAVRPARAREDQVGGEREKEIAFEGESPERAIRSVRAAVTLLSQGKIGPKPGLDGQCYRCAGQKVIVGEGDLVLGILDQGVGFDRKIWHAVVMDAEGRVYEPSYDVWFGPGVLEELNNFIPVRRMGFQEVLDFAMQRKKWPDPVQLKLRGSDQTYPSAEDVTPLVEQERGKYIIRDKLEYEPIDPAKPIPNPVNDGQLAADPEGTLVCMACSQTKAETAGEMIEVYQGPLWTTLKKHMGDLTTDNILVLSGKHGWQSPGLRIEPYNERLSKQRADELIRLGLTGRVAHNIPHAPGKVWYENSPYQMMTGITRSREIRNVIIVGAGDYQRAFRAAITQAKQAGLLTNDVAIVETKGGIGEQRRQLRGFLDQVNGREALAGRWSQQQLARIERIAKGFEAEGEQYDAMQIRNLAKSVFAVPEDQQEDVLERRLQEYEAELADIVPWAERRESLAQRFEDLGRQKDADAIRAMEIADAKREARIERLIDEIERPLPEVIWSRVVSTGKRRAFRNRAEAAGRIEALRHGTKVGRFEIFNAGDGVAIRVLEWPGGITPEQEGGAEFELAPEAGAPRVGTGPRFAESGWDFVTTFPRPHAESRYAEEIETPEAAKAMHDELGEEVRLTAAAINWMDFAINEGRVGNRKLTTQQIERLQEEMDRLGALADGYAQEYEMAFGNAASVAFMGPRVIEGNKMGRTMWQEAKTAGPIPDLFEGERYAQRDEGPPLRREGEAEREEREPIRGVPSRDQAELPFREEAGERGRGEREVEPESAPRLGAPSWEREDMGGGYARYYLYMGGRPAPVVVEWVGHPTAIWKYQVKLPFDYMMERNAGTFMTSKQAKEWALQQYVKWAEAEQPGPVVQVERPPFELTPQNEAELRSKERQARRGTVEQRTAIRPREGEELKLTTPEGTVTTEPEKAPTKQDKLLQDQAQYNVDRKRAAAELWEREHGNQSGAVSPIDQVKELNRLASTHKSSIRITDIGNRWVAYSAQTPALDLGMVVDETGRLADLGPWAQAEVRRLIVETGEAPRRVEKSAKEKRENERHQLWGRVKAATQEADQMGEPQWAAELAHSIGLRAQGDWLMHEARQKLEQWIRYKDRTGKIPKQFSLFQQAATYGVPLDTMQVEFQVVEAESGESVTIQERADVALAEADEKIDQLRMLLECLRS